MQYLSLIVAVIACLTSVVAVWRNSKNDNAKLYVSIERIENTTASTKETCRRIESSLQNVEGRLGKLENRVTKVEVEMEHLKEVKNGE